MHRLSCRWPALAAAVLSSATAATTARAQTFIPTSGGWDVAANWSTGAVPGPTSLAVITARTAIKTAGDISVFSLTLNNGATLRFDQSGNSLNCGSVVFGNTGVNTTASSLLLFDNVIGGSDLLITAASNLSGRIGTIGRVGGGNQPTAIQNNGTINSNVAGNTTLFNSTVLTNTNLIQGTNGANLNFSTGEATVNAAGATIAMSGGGTLSVNVGGITNNGTITLTNSGLNGASDIRGGTINLNGATVTTNSARFGSGATLAGSLLTLANGSNLFLSQNNALNTTSVVFGNTGGNTNASNVLLRDDVAGGSDVVIASGTTLSGRIGTVGRSSFSGQTTTITNNGTITSNASPNTGNGSVRLFSDQSA